MTTEDEATRLLKRADPARGDDSAPFVDAAGYLAALRTRSTTVTLIDTEPTPTQPDGRHRWPIIVVAAAAVVAIGVGGLVIATRDEDPTGQVAADQPTTVAQPTTTVAHPPPPPWPSRQWSSPCAQGPGPEVTQGTEDAVTEVSLPEGEMTITRKQGLHVLRESTVSDVSDPRLEGTWYNSNSVSVEYYLPGDDPSTPWAAPLEIDAVTWRMENDEGAWEGSFLAPTTFPDDEGSVGPRS